jgi:hypothetical protein
MNTITMGIFYEILNAVEPDPIERYRLRLALQADPKTEIFMRELILDRCLPDIKNDLTFKAIGEFLK